MDKELIIKARQTNLAEYLLTKGEPLERSGHRWRHKTHESLVFTDNAFYWNSTGQKGNALDFVMLFYEIDFKTAIEELTSLEIKPIEVKEYSQLQQQPIQNKDYKRIIAYLCKTRKIDYDIIKKLITNNQLIQDERGNAVFKIFNEHGEFVGGEIAGTLTELKFKGMLHGTKKGYGFNIVIGEPKKTLFFESPIDLLSFWTLHKDKIKANRLISLAGLREDIFKTSLEAFKIALESIFLCVDSDQAGQAFITKIQAEFKEIKTYLPPMPAKDWNEFLKK